MTGYMLRPTPNPDRSGRDGTAGHALQRYKGGMFAGVAAHIRGCVLAAGEAVVRTAEFCCGAGKNWAPWRAGTNGGVACLFA